MIDQSVINEITKRLVALYHPRKIYLFGSYAWGLPSQDSDLDIMIIVDELHDSKINLLATGHEILGPLRVAKDLLINTTVNFDERAAMGVTLQAKIKKDGEVLYERH